MTARDTQPSRITSPHAHDFRATAAMVQAGPMQMSVLSFPEHHSVRTPTLVRQSDPERYGLTLVTGGAVWVSQCRNETRVAADGFLLYDSSQPLESRALEAGAQMLILYLPRAGLPLPADRLRPLLAHRISATGGLPAILAQYLSSIVTVPHDDPPGRGETRYLGAAALLTHRMCMYQRFHLDTSGCSRRHRRHSWQ